MATHCWFRTELVAIPPACAEQGMVSSDPTAAPTASSRSGISGPAAADYLKAEIDTRLKFLVNSIVRRSAPTSQSILDGVALDASDVFSLAKPVCHLTTAHC